MENNSSQKLPLISVVMPAYNCAETIEVAIRSITEQTYQNLELIVVDDNSTDDTAMIVQKLAKELPVLHYYKINEADKERINKRGRNINAGWRARNFGFTKTQGEWITFQDADDASLLNRIEIQYMLANKYKATHLCVDWQQFNNDLLGKKLDVERIIKNEQNVMVSPIEITTLAHKTKGIIIPILGRLNNIIPFEWKRLRIINKLFFRSLAPYPGTGNSPLFKREVMEKIKFRPLSERIWPSFMGRGADRDFNFQVAETFKNSYTFFIPLYLWRQNAQNEKYINYKQYLY